MGSVTEAGKVRIANMGAQKAPSSTISADKSPDGFISFHPETGSGSSGVSGWPLINDVEVVWKKSLYVWSVWELCALPAKV
jgi:hypothetical protein